MQNLLFIEDNNALYRLTFEITKLFLDKYNQLEVWGPAVPQFLTGQTTGRTPGPLDGTTDGHPGRAGFEPFRPA